MQTHSLTGKKLGKYHIDAPMGSGGMASVYLATHEALSSQVAIKVLKAEYADNAEIVARFLKEARTAAKLRHPHIVGVHDVENLGPYTYFVMDYIQGLTLKDYLAECGSLPLDEAIAISLQVLSALAAAHATGVIHRDIKPDNILINQEKVCFVSDFGIAKAAGEIDLTRTGVFMGTPRYASPEQIRGEIVDLRTDLYSWAVVMYEMVTGQFAFKDDSITTIIYRVINEVLPAPAEISPAVNPQLSQLISKAMAKLPGERFSSAEEMILALQQIVAGENLQQVIPSSQSLPTTSAAAPFGPRMATDGEKKSGRKNNNSFFIWAGLVALVTLLAGALVLGQTGFFSQAIPEPITEKPVLAVKKPEQASTQSWPQQIQTQTQSQEAQPQQPASKAPDQQNKPLAATPALPVAAKPAKQAPQGKDVSPQKLADEKPQVHASRPAEILPTPNSKVPALPARAVLPARPAAAVGEKDSAGQKSAQNSLEPPVAATAKPRPILTASLNKKSACFLPGENGDVRVKTDAGAHVYLLNLAADNSLMLLYPNPRLPDRPLVDGQLIFPPANLAKELQLQFYPLAEEEMSRESIKVVSSFAPIDFPGLAPSENIYTGVSAHTREAVLAALQRMKGWSEQVLDYRVGAACGK